MKSAVPPPWELLLNGALEAEQDSQSVSFPYDVDIDGMIIRVWAGVYSPRHFYGWRFYLQHLPPVSGQQVLEVGCGAGVAAVRFGQQGASVTACDILPACVDATRANLLRNGIQGARVLVSDVFSAIEERFDTIFWNIPWGFLPADFPQERLTPGTLGNFSVGYKSIARFLAEAPSHLRPGGRVLIVAGEQTAHWALLDSLLSPYTVEVLARGKPSLDGFEHLRLMSLRPLVCL